MSKLSGMPRILPKTSFLSACTTLAAEVIESLLLLVLALVQADANGRDECEVDVGRNRNKVL